MGYIVLSNQLLVNLNLCYTPRWPYYSHGWTVPVVFRREKSGFRGGKKVMEAKPNAGGVKKWQ